MPVIWKNLYISMNKTNNMGTIIYIIGVVLSVIAVLDILKKPISLVGKIISAVLVLATSWVGLAVYFLYAKDKLTSWFK
mgnify:CR=1 FL=1